MGEVRVQVRLINAVDEARARQGELSKDKIRQQLTDAVVDTGSVHLVIPPQVMSILGLSARGRRVAEYADGRKEPVDVTEPLVVDINGRDTIEEALVLGDEVLIGQTVLEKLDLLVDCSSRRLVPNPAHPDQPVTKVK
ncbi:MAG: clan AA aspartic protease [Armatimonadetes bacterium]|nr:clan AA aspartic protease [Armatimonadota bacterium]